MKNRRSRATATWNGLRRSRKTIMKAAMKARGEEVSFLEEEGRGSTTILWQNGSVNNDGGGGREEKDALYLLLLLWLSTNVFDIFLRWRELLWRQRWQRWQIPKHDPVIGIVFGVGIRVVGGRRRINRTRIRTRKGNILKQIPPPPPTY